MRSCVHCGCTENMACMTEFGPCRWVRKNPPECSACVEALIVCQAIEDGELDEDEAA